MEIEVYETRSGKRPFDVWLKKIKETYTRARIYSRLERLQLNNFGDCKALGDEIYELKIHCGAGIRVYYSKIKNKIVLLLCGGDKRSQKKDIKKAKRYLKDYKIRGR